MSLQSYNLRKAIKESFYLSCSNPENIEKILEEHIIYFLDKKFKTGLGRAF